MRIWRDIYSRQAWLHIMQRWESGQGNNAYSTAQEKPQGRVAQLRSVFDSSLRDRSAALQKITQKLESYHFIDKREYKNIDKRVAALQEISALASQWLKVFKVDMDEAKKRYGVSAPRDAERNAFTNSNPTELTMDRAILSLARRSLRKAGYLHTLKAYYAKGGDGHAHRSPQALLALFNQAKESTDQFVGLEPEVRLEQLDPVHRSNYEDMNDGGCGKAFQLWAADITQNVPFFMWLENSMVCVADDKAEAAAQSVPYNRLDLKQSNGGKQRIVLMPAPMQLLNLDQPNAALVMASTQGFSCDQAKDPTGGGGAGVAAYVWSEAGELFIGEHRGHVFHHSSFVSGRRVRCAGMIKMAGGRVTALNNNSGHYKPRKPQLKHLVQWLNTAGAFANTATVECFLGNGQTFQGAPGAFLAS